MKAKYFKKLREKTDYYQVLVTSSLFGSFPYDWDRAEIVLAKDYKHAIKRANKRGYGLNHTGTHYSSCKERWAHFKVKKLNDADHWRNVGFYTPN